MIFLSSCKTFVLVNILVLMVTFCCFPDHMLFERLTENLFCFLFKLKASIVLSLVCVIFFLKMPF